MLTSAPLIGAHTPPACRGGTAARESSGTELADGKGRHGAGERRQVAENTTPKALVIEDDACIARLLCEMLQTLGFTTEYCLDPHAGVALAVSGRYALVTTDMCMPKMNGCEVVRHIREVAPSVPLVVVSGNADDAATRRLESLNVSGVVHKPFTRAQLQSTLRRIEPLNRYTEGDTWDQSPAQMKADGPAI